MAVPRHSKWSFVKLGGDCRMMGTGGRRDNGAFSLGCLRLVSGLIPACAGLDTSAHSLRCGNSRAFNRNQVRQRTPCKQTEQTKATEKSTPLFPLTPVQSIAAFLILPES